MTALLPSHALTESLTGDMEKLLAEDGIYRFDEAMDLLVSRGYMEMRGVQSSEHPGSENSDAEG